MLEPGDSPEQHAADTIAAGRGLCRPSAVEVLVAEAPGLGRRVALARGPLRPRPGGEPALGLEGGHTHRRIVHAGGSETGRELTARLAGRSPPSRGSRFARRPLRWPFGATAGAARECSPMPGEIAAGATVMATGGAAALWSRTTNPWGAIGAGPVLAGAAGADLADLEFCQFHPYRAGRCRAHPSTAAWITEAVRGEGATLLDAIGPALHRRARAARRSHGGHPRAMRAEGIRATSTCAGVDPGRFPNVTALLLEAGPGPATRARPGRPRGPLRDGRRSPPISTGAPRSPASTRWASAAAPACTAPTGSPRTRSASASCSAAGRPLAALASPPGADPGGKRRGGASIPRPSRPASPSGGWPAPCAAPRS